MAHFSLPPSIDARVRAQAEIWRRQAQIPEKERESIASAPFITISRQFGCVAYVLAEALVERLSKMGFAEEFVIYDRKLLELISEKDDISSNLVNSLTNRARSEIEDWVVGVMSGAPSEMKTFRCLARTICAIASKGHAILIGRGGALLTRHLTSGVHIRLIADPEWRLENLKRYPERSKETNMKTLQQVDQERESFVKKYLGADINDPLHYHLVLNNALLPIRTQAETILQLIKNL